MLQVILGLLVILVVKYKLYQLTSHWGFILIINVLYLFVLQKRLFFQIIYKQQNQSYQSKWSDDNPLHCKKEKKND